MDHDRLVVGSWCNMVCWEDKGWGPGPGTKLYNFFSTRPYPKSKKKTTSPTPIIETAHLELEVVILDEVLNQLAP